MGLIDKNRPKEPTFTKQTGSISKRIAGTYGEILELIVDTLLKDGINVNQADLAKRVDKHLKSLEADVMALTGETITEAFKKGQAQHVIGIYEDMSLEEAKEFLGGKVPSNWANGIPTANYQETTPEVIRKVALERAKDTGLPLSQAVKLVTTDQLSRAKVRALFADTYGDVLLATKNTRKDIKKIVRETVRDIAQLNALTDRNYTAQAKDLEKALTKKGLSERVVDQGFKGVIDKAGRRWDVGTYSETVIKTKVNQAYLQGVQYEAEQSGLDLAIISSHGATDACKQWEGVVISMNGKTPGYPTYAEARATNEIFHPRCQHGVHSIRNLNSLAPSDRSKHSEKLADLGAYKNRVYKRKA